MRYDYINFNFTFAEDRWTRRQFRQGWRALYADDPYWAPPPAQWLQHILTPGRCAHLTRMQPGLLRAEAVRRRTPRRNESTIGTGMPISVFEETVGTCAVLLDPRRQDRTAYLAMLHVANDEECLDRLLGAVTEHLWERGVRRMVGPVELSPQLGTGVLVNHFNVVPPLHTPYNPPYLAELLAQNLQPALQRRLFTCSVPDDGHQRATREPSTIRRVDPRMLAGPLLPLMQEVCATPDFPPPDEAEAAFMVEAVGQWFSSLWVALVDNEAAGFVWLQGDYAPLLRRTRGGRNPFWWLWLRLQHSRPTARGRLLLGGVSPRFRDRGIGRQLWTHANTIAAREGWQTLEIGPVDVTAQSAQFLQHVGAHARQEYTLYEGEL